MSPFKLNPTALLLSLMMVLVPAVGVSHEELLQDTLKSMGVGFFMLAATLAFFWPGRAVGIRLKFHWLLALPLALMGYALGSMAWSHSYLGGVELVRWFVFSLILLLGMNTLTPARITPLLWGIHLGAVLSSLWVALQFWFDWSFFPQGPNPASTFVNRNFFAEYAVCTLPFSALLLTRLQDKSSVFLLTFSLGFNVVALMMTGTRSALIGLLGLALLLPVLTLLYRRQWRSTGWHTKNCVSLAVLLMATILCLGSIPSANYKLIKEFGPGDAIDRAFKRTLSLAKPDEYSSGSFSVRAQMWRATLRMISAHPVSGVGAGAWEVHIPKYQDRDHPLEADYYAHNEPLQLLAEYGLTGWLVLLLLLAYWYRAARQTWTEKTAIAQQEAPVRAFTLTSVLVFLLVSNAGFPWHMASTGALFALSLALLAASDSRLLADKVGSGSSLQLAPWQCVGALSVNAVLTGLAIYLTQQAIACESKLVRATQIALTISASGAPNDPRWVKAKSEMLTLLQQGIALNPHYRKLTPLAADAMATWGDWENATWVWESVLASRPFITGMLASAARGQIQAGKLQIAQQDLERAENIQTSAALNSLQIMLWSRNGHEKEAMLQAQTLLRSGYIDGDLVQTAYTLGLQQHQPALAVLALELGIKAWPNRAVDGWLKLGDIYRSADVNDPSQARNAYRQAINATEAAYKSRVISRIPEDYRDRLE